MDFIVAAFLVFLVITIVPIAVYGSFSKFLGLAEPEKKVRFFVGVSIQKAATTIGFIAIYILGKEIFSEQWFAYGLIWFTMYAVTEIGQVFMSDYTQQEAAAGIISEAAYFPLAAYIAQAVL